jgi:hypothetical protein
MQTARFFGPLFRDYLCTNAKMARPGFAWSGRWQRRIN